MNINQISIKIQDILPEAKLSVLLATTAFAISMFSNVIYYQKINSKLIFSDSVEEVKKNRRKL
jgi:hypothetical protein